MARKPAPARDFEIAFAAVEANLLPMLSAIVDATIETASLARPGIDAEAYARHLRALAEDVGGLVASLEQGWAVAPRPAQRRAA